MKMDISQQILESIHIEKLKQLEKVTCTFTGHNLTAILGINGCGKSTILHALACCYQPLTTGEEHKFSEFFLPSNYNVWKDSEFQIRYSFTEKGIPNNGVTKDYKKTEDRWSRYVNRPKRDVFYIGIKTCVPDIENAKERSKINIANKGENPILQTIVDKISYILGGQYQKCYNGSRVKKRYRIVKRDRIDYPSITMGAGEQRLLTILETVFSAPKYSLILIDEIDLTLHTQALNRLLDVLIETANKKHLQIIFTTHRENITQRTDINIRHLYQTNNKTFCFEGINNACMNVLTGTIDKPIKIFVEDQLSKSIINAIAKGLKIQRYCEINTFGDIQNGFTVAAVKAVENKDIKNILVVLDGDKYVSEEEKQSILKKRFSGNTPYEEEIRAKSLSLIKEYNHPQHKSPDRFIIDTVRDLNKESEIHDIVVALGELQNDHDYTEQIADELGIDRKAAGEELIREIQNSDEWKNYVQPIYEWLQNRKQNLALEIPQ